jgi:putative ABC transport system permease protein
MIGFLRATRAVRSDGLPISPLVLLLAAGMGVAVTVTAAAVPAFQAARTGPLEALRPSRRAGRSLGARLRWIAWLELAVIALGVILYPFERGSAPMIAIVLAVGLLLAGAFVSAWLLLPLGRVVGRPFEWLFGAEGMLGRANLGRDRVRTGLTVASLVVALAAVVALGSVAASARQTAERWIGSVLPGGTAIRMPLPDEIDLFRPTFTSITGVRAASPIAEFPAVVDDGDAAREVSMAAIDPSVFQDAGSLVFAHGERAVAFNALRDGGAVLVPEPMALRDGITIGDSLALAEPGAAASAFTVVGIVAYTLPARSPDGALLISLTDAQAAFGVTSASLWALVPEPGVTAAAFRSAVADTARSLAAEPIDAEQLAGDLARSFDRLVGLFDVLAVVAVAVAAAGIVNALSMGVVERAREIAILRSHGMTIGQVQAMVVAEAAILGAVGGVIAAGTGLAVAWAMVVAGASRDFAGGLAIPWPLVISCVLLGIGVASLAGIYPARRAGRQSIVGNLQHFE